MKLVEYIIKLIFFRRVKKAKKIGEAAKLIEEGKVEEALKLLDKIGKKIPPYLGFLYFLTRGKAYEALKEFTNAEHCYIASALLMEGINLAYLHLAILYGKLCKFKEAKEWLNRVIEYIPRDQLTEDDLKLKEQAKKLLELIEDIEKGGRLNELQCRAVQFADRHKIDFSPNSILKLKEWFNTTPNISGEELEDLALYLGELGRRVGNYNWHISLELDSSFIEKGGKKINPFEFVKECMDKKRELDHYINFLKHNNQDG